MSIQNEYSKFDAISVVFAIYEKKIRGETLVIQLR